MIVAAFGTIRPRSIQPKAAIPEAGVEPNTTIIVLETTCNHFNPVLLPLPSLKFGLGGVWNAHSMNMNKRTQCARSNINIL